jgi:2-dehydropantoate 2-reductase
VISPLRFLIYGSGAVGGVVGAALCAAGHQVTLVARGEHLAALRERGLELRTPGGTTIHRIPAVEDPDEADIDTGTIIILAVKSQDTAGALEKLALTAPPDVALVCAQNGVENERAALRRFRRVYGASVIIPATHLEPGRVEALASPVLGVLELGRYPTGCDGLAVRLATELTTAGFAARGVGDVMRWKYAKLLSNVGNAVNAITGRSGSQGPLYEAARAEALACYAVAGIEFTPVHEDHERRRALSRHPSTGALPSPNAASSWQSLARRTGRVETDFLNGEIVLLGRLHGIPTPVNEALQLIVRRMAAEHAPPGSVSEERVVAEIESLRVPSGGVMGE